MVVFFNIKTYQLRALRPTCELAQPSIRNGDCPFFLCLACAGISWLVLICTLASRVKCIKCKRKQTKRDLSAILPQLHGGGLRRN